MQVRSSGMAAGDQKFFEILHIRIFGGSCSNATSAIASASLITRRAKQRNTRFVSGSNRTVNLTK